MLAALLLAPAAEAAPLPQPLSPLTLERPRDHSERMPRSIGRQSHRPYLGRFFLNLDQIPDPVGRQRFADLAIRSGSRWGVGYAGTTGRRVVTGDGVPVVGFSSNVPSGALGATSIRIERTRRCSRTRCRTRTRVVDQDIAINPNVGWQDGPTYPSILEFDLETVLLHELGHFAGNLRHVFGCESSPMIDRIAQGDWWHAPNDWWRIGCAQSASQGPEAQGRPHTLRFIHVQSYAG